MNKQASKLMSQSIEQLRKHVEDIELQELYKDEIISLVEKVDGLSDEGRRILTRVYSKVRSNGVDKEYSERVALNAVKKAEMSPKIEKVYSEFADWINSIKVKHTVEDAEQQKKERFRI